MPCAITLVAILLKLKKATCKKRGEEIASNKGIYSCLFSFGVRSLRSRECGLYEASDVHVSEASLQLLQGRVIYTIVKDKFLELQSSGNAPVCMFPLKKDCVAFNEEMLNSLVTDRVKIQELPCMDAIEETMGNVKWNAKAVKQLESLNQDCNKTASLEYVLRLHKGINLLCNKTTQNTCSKTSITHKLW